MGPGNTKLAELDTIKDSFRQQAEQIQKVENYVISDLAITQTRQIIDQLWNIIAELKVGIGQAKIVANSKALYHLLPSLLPPID
jgi:hypothetical protein